MVMSPCSYITMNFFQEGKEKSIEKEQEIYLKKMIVLSQWKHDKKQNKTKSQACHITFKETQWLIYLI
jgi:hypothetical protein